MVSKQGLIGTLILFTLTGCQPPAEQAAESRTPLQVVLNDLGDNFQGSLTDFTLQQRTLGETVEFPQQVELIVEETLVVDDSIAAQRTTYQLSYQQQQWRITDKRQQQRCLPGRGSQHFSAALCH